MDFLEFTELISIVIPDLIEKLILCSLFLLSSVHVIIACLKEIKKLSDNNLDKKIFSFITVLPGTVEDIAEVKVFKNNIEAFK